MTDSCMLLWRVAPSPRQTWRLSSVLMLPLLLMTGCTVTVTGESAQFSASDLEQTEIFEQVQPPALGACLDTVRGGSGPLGPPQTVDCSDPHGGEVARVVDVPAALDGSYPTDGDLDSAG